jgi:hypothetical protein
MLLFLVSETVRFFSCAACGFLARVACVQCDAGGWEVWLRYSWLCPSPRVCARLLHLRLTVPVAVRSVLQAFLSVLLLLSPRVFNNSQGQSECLASHSGASRCCYCCCSLWIGVFSVTELGSAG